MTPLCLHLVEYMRRNRSLRNADMAIDVNDRGMGWTLGAADLTPACVLNLWPDVEGTRLSHQRWTRRGLISSRTA